ncbi:hypothetical protein [Aeromonas veronii]
MSPLQRSATDGQSKQEIKKKIAARLEKIAKHEGKIKKLKKALK